VTIREIGDKNGQPKWCQVSRRFLVFLTWMGYGAWIPLDDRLVAREWISGFVTICELNYGYWMVAGRILDDRLVARDWMHWFVTICPLI
jgi:hypothetical protein